MQPKINVFQGRKLLMVFLLLYLSVKFAKNKTLRTTRSYFIVHNGFVLNIPQLYELDDQGQSYRYFSII